MTVLSEVEQALSEVHVAAWQVEVARSLASAMDEDPNASLARELRLLMADLTQANASVAEVDPSDDLAAKRAARRRAAGS